MNTPRPTVALFATEMERVLRENDHKGGWKRSSFPYLLSRLCGEISELLSSFETPENRFNDSARDNLLIVRYLLDNASRLLLDTGPLEQTKETAGEAIDVGNFAMMIWDLSRVAACPCCSKNIHVLGKTDHEKCDCPEWCPNA